MDKDSHAPIQVKGHVYVSKFDKRENNQPNLEACKDYDTRQNPTTKGLQLKDIIYRKRIEALSHEDCGGNHWPGLASDKCGGR